MSRVLNRLNIRRYTQVAEFWIVILFLVRLIGITALPLEGSHNWRQCTCLMVARNIYEGNCDMLHPMVDDTGASEGIIGMEFPLLSELHALAADVFGYSHWYGRLINLIVSSLGLCFFAKILRLLRFNEKTVLVSTIFLGVSIWFCFSRKIMPDTFCISLVFIALYCGLRYLKNSGIVWLLAYTIMATVAVLSKIPAAIYLVLLLPAVLHKGWSLRNRILLVMMTFFPVIATVCWYFLWNPYLSATYGNWYNQGVGMLDGFVDTLRHPKEVLDNFYFDAFDGFLLFVASFAGLILLAVRKEKKWLEVFLLMLLTFLLYVFKSGYNFYDQNYYIIPFVPIMAILAGYAVSAIPKTWLFVVITLVCCSESVGNQQHDFWIKDKEMYKADIAAIMKDHTNDGLVLVNGNGNPQLLYLSHRKGWSCSNDDISDEEFMSRKYEQGCKYVVVDLHTWPDFSIDATNVWRGNDFAIISCDSNSYVHQLP